MFISLSLRYCTMSETLLPSTTPIPLITNGEFVCDKCKAIDFNKALAIPPARLREGVGRKCGVLLDTNASRYARSPNTNCKLCRILRSTICWYHGEWSDPDMQAGQDATENFELYAFASSRNVPWGYRNPEPDQDYHILITLPAGFFSSFGDHSRECGRGEAGYVFCFAEHPKPGLFRPQLVLQQFDYQRARLWLDFCKGNHAQQCCSMAEIVPGMKLIDCEAWSVVKAEPGMRWVALSYVWSPENNAQGPPKADQESPSTRLLSSVSNSIKDAATVVKQLGLRYLWVDRYCIDQRNVEAKAFHISHMDVIYRGAELVIVAAAGSDENYGLPGVGSTPRLQQETVQLESSTIFTTGPDPRWHVQENSRWSTRGWTFQEGLLASRRLIFTEHQAYFECHEATWMEAVGSFEFTPNRKNIDLTSMKAGRKRLFKSLGNTISTTPYIPPSVSDGNSERLNGDFLAAIRIREWCHLVGRYTSRTLSHDSDSLDAFAGIARMLSKLEPGTLHLVGLPYVLKKDDSELIDKYFSISFCWYHNQVSAQRRRPGFPSWTWAGWEGSTAWMGGWILKSREECFPRWRNVRIQHSTKEPRPVAQHLAQHHSADYGIALSLSICFEARIVPSYFFEFNVRKPGDGRVNHSYSEDEESVDHVDGEEDDDDGDEESESDEEDSDNNSYGESLRNNENDGSNGEGGNGEVNGEDSEKENEGSRTRAPAVPDQDDWALWTVGKHGVPNQIAKPTSTPREFFDRLDDGTWSCLLIGDYEGNNSFTHERFLLIVKWIDEKTATRVGALVLQQHPYVDAAFPNFFDDSGLDWRSVRLV
ncbi:HET-domain-containing protein [Daldinia sp. FL1419]|nr:HET-domain-containing protein [Daldinia sp. FL1419]